MNSHRHLGRLLAVAALALATVLAPVPGPAAQAATAVREAYFVAPDNTLRRLVNGQNVNTGLLVRTGTSPVAVHHPQTGTTEAVYVTSEGRLAAFRAGSFTYVGGGPYVRAGTSPTVTTSGSKAVVAYHRAGDSHLVTIDENGKVRDSGIETMPQSSPAISVEGPWRYVVFNGRDGYLWRFTWVDIPGDQRMELERVPGQHQVAAGSTPTVSGTSKLRAYIAFRSTGNNELWYVDRNKVSHHTGIILAPGSSPVMATTGNGRPVIAYQGTDKLLRALDVQTFTTKFIGNGLGLGVNTSPSLSAGSGQANYVASFSSEGGNTLWTVDESGNQIHYGFPVRAGSSPAVVAR